MDTELVRRAQRGDEEAFALLAGPLATRFIGIARRILHDVDLAQDAAQLALFSTWEDLPQLNDPDRFEAWSYRVLVRTCYAESRRRRRQAQNLRLLPVTRDVTDDNTVTVIDRELLEAGFRRLSIEHRTILVLHHYLDLPLDRVAEILGIPVGTSHSRLNSAMRALRAAIDADSRPPAREGAR